MTKKLFILFFLCASFQLVRAQSTNTDSIRNAKKDSTLRAMIHADSVKVNKQFEEMEKWDKMESRALYPLFKAGKFSGVIPVENPTEIPDPNIDYKLLFELTSVNPDSTAAEVNDGLMEVVRKLNLHVASGIPVKRIMPVIVVHAAALHAFKNNIAYQKKYKMDNPNIKVIDELKKLGAKFIMCGQAMAFMEVKKDELLPDMRISVTAQTVLSHYQLKGYVLYQVQ